jgi:predicted RNA-binding Zn-ribbon protein involved in translation (DUF1610 family)
MSKTRDLTPEERDDFDHNVMGQQWCCVICANKFPFGKLKATAFGVACPHCGSTEVARADGQIADAIDPENYPGPQGTLQ